MDYKDSFFFDEKKGLVLPTGMRQIKSSPNPISPAKGSAGVAQQTPTGVRMSHDEEFGVPIWPNYASGYDDVLNRGIASGSMANGGMTPVINTMIPTLVSKLQMMAATWVIALRGKKSPLTKALDIINSADDGDGSHTFVRAVIGTMLTDNRGVFVSYAPIGRIEYDTWGTYGFQTEPLNEKTPQYRVLTIGTESVRENRGLWTIDGLNCVPTGVPEFPYWLRKKSVADKKEYWILVPREYGTQIVQHVGSKSEPYAGMGTSNVWICSKYAAQGMVMERTDWEAMSTRPPEGVALLTGADTPSQLQDSVKAFRAESKENGNLLYEGTMFASTVSENARLTLIQWSTYPQGYDPEKWDNEAAQAISGAFHVSPVHVRAAMVGSGQAIETLMTALEGETSLAYSRNILESLLNLGTPPRVYIKLIPKSDSQLHRQSETFAVFALALTRVQKQFGANNPDAQGKPQEVLTIAEVRALIEQEIGIKIPDTSPDTEQADTRDSAEDLAATYISRRNLAPINGRMEYAAAGRLLANDEGRLFLSTGEGSSLFLWCIPLVGIGRFLLPVNSLYTIPDPPPPPPKRIASYSPREERLLMEQRHLAAAFIPDGDALPVPTEEDAVVEDWEAAADEALALWDIHMAGTAYANLFEWEWDPETRAWINPDSGEPLTALEMAEIRQLLIDQVSLAEREDEGSLINLLIALTIALGWWEEQMRLRLLAIHLALYLFGNGNVELSDADKARIEAEQFKQITFLNGFARAMDSGDLTEASARNRATQYYDSAAGSHERGRVSAWDQEMVLPCYPGDCSTPCCARCGCYWSLALVGTLIEATWFRTKIESCEGCLSREACDPITFDPETGEYTNVDCYVDEADNE